jgi:23S rRNA pseudouridine2605 synthase
MRINRFLAASGLGSRRSCEELIIAGKVTINGQVCQNLATEVGDEDFVKVGSRRIQPEKHTYILLHKPRGYLCTASDTHERRTIFDLLPGQWPRLFHVGRLDRDSEGLLILTNDGDLGLKLTHPRFKMEKEYEVLLDRPYNGATDTPKLLRGVSIEGGRAKAESVRQLSPVLLRIVLRQGLKRQIRQMLYKLGYEVERLIRIRIGPLRLTELRAGEWRMLKPAEVKSLSEAKPAPETKPAPIVRTQESKRGGKGGDAVRKGRPERARGDKRHFPGGAGKAGGKRNSLPTRGGRGRAASRSRG